MEARQTPSSPTSTVTDLDDVLPAQAEADAAAEPATAAPSAAAATPANNASVDSQPVSPTAASAAPLPAAGLANGSAPAQPAEKDQRHPPPSDVAAAAAAAAAAASKTSAPSLRWAPDPAGGAAVADDDGDDEDEDGDSGLAAPRGPRAPTRYSTSFRRRESRIRKEGLLKRKGNFKSWEQLWFGLAGSTLYYAPSASDELHTELSVAGASLAERSDKNIDNAFELITPFETLVLQAESRGEMESWLRALKAAATARTSIPMNEHHWFYAGSKRAVFCNVCREQCGGLGNKSLACEVCACRVHAACAGVAPIACKWTAFETIPADCITDHMMHHQWVEGNLPPSSKCSVCHKSCGSTRRLQDFRCLWCFETVHAVCKLATPLVCSLGRNERSIFSPMLLKMSEEGGDGGDRGNESGSPQGSPVKRTCSIDGLSRTDDPIIVFVNPKSGSNDGVQLMRLFKRLLNPAQVFDLTHGGPSRGLALLKHTQTFRALGCGGDGTIGWILQEADKMGIHNCQLAMLPLGTGNDLSRILGWGPAFTDIRPGAVADFLEAVETAKVALLDRWSLCAAPLSAPTPSQSLSPSPTPASAPASPLPVSPAPASGTFESFTPSPVRVGSDGRLRLSSIQRSNPLSELAARASSGLSSPQQAETFGFGFGTLSEDPSQLEEAREQFSRVRSRAADLEQAAAGPAPAEQLDVRAEDFVTEALSLWSMLTVLAGEAGAGAGDEQAFKALCDGVREAASSPADASASTTVAARASEVMQQLEAAADCTMGDHGGLQRRTSTTSYSTEFPAAKVPPGPTVATTTMVAPAAPAKASQAAEAAEVAAATGGQSPEGKEISVMNNYFGIGLDAKIAYDFNTLRDEHPEKCRSRMKNQMWYALLGGRQMMAQSCKNLNERITLECDGKVLKLPRIQGIVVLNINSYMGGTSFWGNRQEAAFQEPSPNDGVLEVVSVRGSSQMAACKALPGVTPRRLCQAQSIRIIISGTDPVPIQVDGEAWMQPPGVLTLNLKNKMPMLIRDLEFHKQLASWAPSARRSSSQISRMDSLLQHSLRLQEAFEKVAAVPYLTSKLPDLVKDLDRVVSTRKRHEQTQAAESGHAHERSKRPDISGFVAAMQVWLNTIHEAITQAPAEPSLEEAHPPAEHSADWTAFCAAFEACDMAYQKVEEEIGANRPARPMPPGVRGWLRRTFSGTAANKVPEGRASRSYVRKAGSASAADSGSPLVDHQVGTRRASLNLRQDTSMMGPLDNGDGSWGPNGAAGGHKRGSKPAASCAAMDIDDVCRWLAANGMAQYVDAFRRKGIAGRHLEKLGVDALADLGLASDSLQRLFFTCLQDLRESLESQA